MDKVTIGRIVRFVDNNQQEWPAIITVVHGEPNLQSLVSLQAFRQADITPATSIPFDAGGAPFSWHWPARP